MGDDPPPAYGLDDAALADHPTVFAPGSLAGRTVLISGGGGGLGRATGWLMGRLGARLVLTGRDAAKLDQATTAMAERGIAAVGRVVDIREPDAVAALFAQIADDGGVDILVNSAGGQFPQAAIDFSAKGWNTVINTNLNGTWHMMQGAARLWRDAARGGSIVNIVVVTRQGLHGVAHSVAARAGVVGLSQALAVEWAPLGIRINCVAPGTIETPGWRVYTPEVIAHYPDSNPMKRAGTAWDVAEAVAYLAGDAGRYVTGEVLHVAGGSQLWGETWTIPRPAWFDPDG
ncbi:SDR family oxidoreductase [Novosphingobium sp.]|uniref:SDR family NAD(P)-dependent oxidoreductase n=1 Tax=Novosphingobium sp. TaxID=1874826 RepID=UPI00334213FC